jgi:hypothetical protein
VRPRPSPLLSRDALDLIRRPPHDPGMDRRRFLVTSLAGALAAPLAVEGQSRKRHSNQTCARSRSKIRHVVNRRATCD